VAFEGRAFTAPRAVAIFVIYVGAEVIMLRWTFSTGARLAAEQKLVAKLRAGSKFYRFLFEVRDELFDDEFQDVLAGAFDPRGQEPVAPAFVAMVNLLQRYTGLGDRDAVETAENDRRWQAILGTLGSDEAGFGQGSLVRFRVRMAEHDLDKKLVERTIEIAKRTKKFGWKNLKAVLDSSPLEGAGRVEDTWNLIGRAMSKVVGAVSAAMDIEAAVIVEGAGLTLLEASSIKAALDIDWSDEEARLDALQVVIEQAELLEAWVRKEMKDDADKPPVSDALALMRRVVEQDIEPDPDGGGERIRDGVAKDRIISIGDPEMRHGRKSKSKTIKGYKRHIVVGNGVILGTALEPANRPEHVPTRHLVECARQHGELEAVLFDRGYLAANDDIAALKDTGVKIHSRAWRSSNGGVFGKEHFQLCLDAGVVGCPMGKVANVTKSGLAMFDEADCLPCPLKRHCTNGRRRSVHLHENEALLIELRAAQMTPQGRHAYRARTIVEHKLARVDAVQGSRARYTGVRKNELDLNRAAAVINLQEIARLRRAG
jgi:hypothetical protein